MKEILFLMILISSFYINATKPGNSKDYFDFMSKLEEIKKLMIQKGYQAVRQDINSLAAQVNMKDTIGYEERWMFVQAIEKLKSEVCNR